ncbi:PD-(D/E)XK nuclease family protein [Hugenholtzia roseola]|uniref:PD-(D/E)XK nuclease family protein n=1 Tax=Hugenholtzia roseola TaxID=1002 RepID=UPI00047956F2|nr:PD-(D/E)XK nuclease family protein [Hugenholtzia roseola]
MKPFLRLVAEELYQTKGEDLEKLYIVLPSRRASLYLKAHLADVITHNIFAPHILAIEDFVSLLTETETLDNTTLLFKLFQSFKKFDRLTGEGEIHSMERFSPLGMTLLMDFNAIDRDLVEAKDLFDYLDKVKSIERWAEEFGTEIEIDERSRLGDYYKFWQIVSQTYFDFRKTLEREKKAYTGLIFREVAENVSDLVEGRGIEQVVFAGFNNLFKSEEKIIRNLEKSGKALCFWDIDEFYLKNPVHEAGKYFRRYQEQKIIKKEPQFISNSLSSTPKTIRVLSVANQVTQAKLAGFLLEKTLNEIIAQNKFSQFAQSRNHTAILLPDESLLLPMLYSLPESSAGVDVPKLVNITMGVSLKNTPFYTLIANIFQMQENMLVDEQGRALAVYHKDLIRLLQHPYLRSQEEDENPPLIRLKEENLVYFPIEELKQYKKNGWFYGRIFDYWKDDTNQGLFYFFNLIEELAHRLPELPEESLESEYIFEFYKLLKHIETLLQLYGNLTPRQAENESETEEKTKVLGGKKDNLLSFKAFKNFILELLKERRIPFTGEPIAPIQIMGMLESRALDFENVIVLSCNEGVLPRGKVLNSLIPFEVRRTSGLPTYSEDDSVYAYHFYRILQRAKNITLIYSTDTEGSRNGERSRFIAQIANELAHLPHIQYSEETINLSLPTQNVSKWQVEKDEVIQKRVETYLTESGITPTYLSQYLEDPMQFFENKVVGLERSKEVEEDMLQNTFGTVLHQTLELIFKPFIGKTMDKSQVYQIKENKDALHDLVELTIKEVAGGLLQDTGKNFLLKEITHSLVPRFLEKQAAETPFVVVGLEANFRTQIPFVFKGKNKTLILKGTADRIDLDKDGVLRVIDYKTGRLDSKELKAATIADLAQGKAPKALQLVLYKYLLIRALEAKQVLHLPTHFELKEDTQILSGFWFFRRLGDGFTSYQIKEEAKTISGFKKEVEDLVISISTEMLDATLPFSIKIETKEEAENEEES